MPSPSIGPSSSLNALTKVAQDGAKLASNCVQKSTKNRVLHWTWRAKIAYPISFRGQKFEKKKDNEDFDKAAEDIRLATRHLGMIVGKVDVEEILGSIFNDFCIGK